MIITSPSFRPTGIGLWSLSFCNRVAPKGAGAISGSVNPRHGTGVTHGGRVLPRRETSRVVVAHLTEDDFASARLTIPEIGAFEDYQNWLDFRTSALFGLEAAGFSVEQVTVDIGKFTRWSESTSITPSISALDEFASAALAVIHEPWDNNRFQAPAEPFQ